MRLKSEIARGFRIMNRGISPLNRQFHVIEYVDRIQIIPYYEASVYREEQTDRTDSKPERRSKARSVHKPAVEFEPFACRNRGQYEQRNINENNEHDTRQQVIQQLHRLSCIGSKKV